MINRINKQVIQTHHPQLNPLFSKNFISISDNQNFIETAPPEHETTFGRTPQPI